MVEVIFLPCLLLFIGLSATFGVVCYFSEKIIGNSDEKLHANPANKVREKYTSDHEKFSAPKPKNKNDEFQYKISGLEKREIELKENISKISATNRIINSDKHLDVDLVQSKLTRNKVDVCDHTKDVKAPKVVWNDQHFVEGSLPVRYPNETGSPVQSSIKTQI